MDKLKFYKIATGCLLLLNIGILAFFFFTKPDRKPPRGNLRFQNEAIRILDLNKDQEQQFLKLVEVHGQQILSKDNELKELLKSYFKALKNDSPSNNEETILSRIQATEALKLKLTYQHFKEVKSLLKQDQLDRYKTFVDEAMNKVI